MSSIGGPRRRLHGRTRWTRAVGEQLAILHETHATARLIRKDFGLSRVESIDNLVEVVAQRRGKPISVVQLSLPSRVSAFCIATPERDFIAVDIDASELTQINGIAHELGHFLFDDAEDEVPAGPDGEGPLPKDLALQLAPALDPDSVTAFFQRSHYDSRIERKVEAFATVMLERYIAIRQPDTNGLTSTFTHRRTGV